MLIKSRKKMVIARAVTTKGGRKMINSKPLEVTIKCESNEDVARAMSIYVRNLQAKYKTDPKWAKKDAHQALIDGGVLTKDGKLKDQIVTE